MDPAEFAALAKRLIDDAKDGEALAAAHMMELTDPGGYALLLEKVAYGSGDPRVGSRWFVQAATVWAAAMGDVRRSENLLRKAVKSDPWNDQAMDRLGRVYDDRGDIDTLLSILEGRATACTNKASEVEDGKTRAGAMWADIGRRHASARPARAEKALAAFERAILVDPKNLDAIGSSRAILIASERWAEAIAMFDKERALLRKSADHVRLLREEALVRRAAGDVDGVVQALRLAMGCDDNDLDVTEELANCLLERIKAGDGVPAEQRAEAASLFLVLAETYEGEIALSHALNALTAEPGNDKAMELAGRIAASLRHEAVLPAHWAAYLKASPNGAHATRVRMAIADSHEAAGQYSEAAEVLLPLEAHNGKVAQRVLGLLKKAGRVDDLVTRLDRQAASLPPDARFDVVLQAARMLAKAGRAEAAVQRYTQLLAIHPGFSEAVKVVSEHLRERKDLKGLCAVLLSAARHAKTSAEQRATMLREVARLSIEVGDYDEAYEILSKLHHASRGDEAVREQLKKVLEHTARWDDLMKLLGREIGAARSAEETVAALRQLANLQEHRMGDLEQAANAWSRISMLAPDDAAALMSGVELYEKAKRQDLSASLLATGIARMKNDSSRATAFGRLAELLEKLNKPTEAADAHISRAKLTGAQESWRAAERLYATCQAWDKAGEALSSQIASATDPKQLAALHARQASYLGQAGDPDGSVRCLEQACELDIDEDSYVAELERRNEAAGHLRRFVDFLLQRAGALQDKTKRSALRRRAARILRERLDDRHAALDTLRAVLQDEEDPGALALLAADAESRQQYTEACELLSRLQASLSEPAARTPILLKLAKTRADSLGDVDGALQVLESILGDSDPRNREAIREIVRLQGARGDWGGVVATLERARANAEISEHKKQLALDLSEVYERKLEDLERATELALVALEIEPGDRVVTRRLSELYEVRGDWERVIDTLSQLIAAEPDPEVIPSLVLKRARVFEQKLDKVDEALGGLEVLGDAGDDRCRKAFVEIADRSGRGELAASTLEGWAARDTSTAMALEALVGAFDRYVSMGKLTEALRVIRKIDATDAIFPALVLRLEAAALGDKDFEIARSVQEIVLSSLTGLERATERARQAEVLVAAGADSSQTLRAAEGEFVGLTPQEVQPLLGRLAQLTSTAEERLGLYERQVARAAGRSARITAIACAVGVAARHGLMAQCKRLFLLGVSISTDEADILPLEREATEVDKELDGTSVRRAFTEALVEAAATARGGEARRGALLRKAALIAHRDLGDIAQAFDWFNEALFVRIESSMVAMSASIQALSEQVRELKGSLNQPKSDKPASIPPRKGPPPLPAQAPGAQAAASAAATPAPPKAASTHAESAGAASTQAAPVSAKPASTQAAPVSAKPSSTQAAPVSAKPSSTQAAPSASKAAAAGPPPLPQQGAAAGPPPLPQQGAAAGPPPLPLVYPSASAAGPPPLPGAKGEQSEADAPILVDLAADDEDATQSELTDTTETSQAELTLQDFKSPVSLERAKAHERDSQPTMEEPPILLDALSDLIVDQDGGDETIRRPLVDVLKEEMSERQPSDKKRVAPAEDPRVRLFASVSEMFAQSDLRKAGEVVLKLGMEAVSGAAGMFHLLDTAKREFVVVCCAGMTNDVVPGHRTAADESTAAELVQKKYVATTVESGAERWYLGKRWWGISPAPHLVIGVSIERQGKVVGLLEIASITPGVGPDEKTKEALAYLAERVGEYVAAHPNEQQQALQQA